MAQEAGEKGSKKKLFARFILCVVILVLGFLAKAGLTAMRKTPPPADLPPQKIRIEVATAIREDVPVTISGYGEVRAIDSLAITPKVAGEVVYLHPQLEVGNVIEAGELLFRLDQRDYLAAQAQGNAQVERLTIMIDTLKQQYESDKNRVENIRRSRDIAEEEFKRDDTLYKEQDVGSASMVNLSEINYRKAQDAFDQVQQAIDLYPKRIQEAEAGLKAAQAALEMAKLSLERTEVFAPFKARIQLKQIELGQAVAPGLVVLMLANDSVLEISVPIDSRDARLWLPFKEEDQGGEANWFRAIDPAPCKITWTEDEQGPSWTGAIHRIERFDPMTRQVTVIIRVTEDTRKSDGDTLPLVEGMFCKVEIPGKPMKGVFRLPRWTVSFDGKTYLADGDRLRRREVNVVRTQGEETFVDSGIEPGELIVTTRLVDPVPGILIEYDQPGTAVPTATAEPAK